MLLGTGTHRLKSSLINNQKNKEEVKIKGYMETDIERLLNGVVTLPNNIIYRFLTYTWLNFR